MPRIRAPRAGQPVQVLKRPLRFSFWPDEGVERPTTTILVQNFFEELKRLVPN